LRASADVRRFSVLVFLSTLDWLQGALKGKKQKSDVPTTYLPTCLFVLDFWGVCGVFELPMQRNGRQLTKIRGQAIAREGGGLHSLLGQRGLVPGCGAGHVVIKKPSASPTTATIRGRRGRCTEHPTPRAPCTALLATQPSSAQLSSAPPLCHRSPLHRAGSYLLPIYMLTWELYLFF
jgi:hypothetical protein